MLDPALIRPGRFDRIIYVGAPDFEGRIEVLKVSGVQRAPLISRLQSRNAIDGRAACVGGGRRSCLHTHLLVCLAGCLTRCFPTESCCPLATLS